MDLNYAYLTYTSNSGVNSNYWKNEYYCDRVDADSPKRFNRGWIHATKDVSSMVKDTVYGYVNEVRLLTELPPTDGCPDSYNGSYSWWVKTDYTFADGQEYETIVTQKYGGDGNADDNNPGHSGTSERIYFTDELGITRKEHWHRLGYGQMANYENVSDVPAYDDNKKMWRCGDLDSYKPYNLPSFPNGSGGNWKTGSVLKTSNGVFYEVNVFPDRDTPNKRDTWVLVGCSDFTNVVAPAGYSKSQGYPKVEIHDSLDVFFKHAN